MYGNTVLTVSVCLFGFFGGGEQGGFVKEQIDDRVSQTHQVVVACDRCKSTGEDKTDLQSQEGCLRCCTVVGLYCTTVSKKIKKKKKKDCNPTLDFCDRECCRYEV